MPTLYPIQDVFTRGEISPRLHARASLDLYRAALSKCENFITLPHGGVRKRGGTYFVGELKTSTTMARLIPFIFSADQAYALEFGNLYVRVYAYGARVGTVEVVTPYLEAELPELQVYQSADVMWITHPDHPTQTLTRTAHTTWTLAEFVVEDGPYIDINETTTTLTPAARGSLTPTMTSLTAPSGTVSSSGGVADAWQVFDADKRSRSAVDSNPSGWVKYRLAGGAQKVADAYWVTSAEGDRNDRMPTAWEFQGSNNDVDWTTLDGRTNETAWSAAETRFFEFDNAVPFEYHRLSFRGAGGSTATDAVIAELSIHESALTQAAFNLTASAVTGINDGAGFQTADVGRSVRLLGSDGRWRWAKIITRTSTTVVTVKLNGHALPDLSPITRWRLGAWSSDEGWPGSVTVFEERLAVGKKFRINASKTGDFNDFGLGEADDDGLEFLQAGGGQANDIVWITDADGALLIATAGGIHALSGSGIDEALTPSSFKNRKSRTFGAAPISPVDAGQSFLYVTRSRKAIAELTQAATGKYTSDDVGQISEHIPKKGVIELAFQTDPDPLLWFPLDNGELGGYTHQPSQEVRGMHRHDIAGSYSGSDWGIVESACVTPGQDGNDDLWLVVKRTIGGVTKRYIEIKSVPFEYGDIGDAFEVDCGLTYTGAAVGTVSGLSHLNGQVVDALAGGKVYKGLTVSGGQVALPGGATATKWQVGLPYTAAADSLELDVGGKDGSIIGRRKKVAKVILSLFETDVSGLSIQSYQRGRWEPVRIPSIVPSDGMATLFTGNVDVPIDDSWEGQGRVRIRHQNPTPCTIRAFTPVFDAEP